MPTKTQYTQTQLKQAYTLVAEHLAQALLQAKTNQTVRLGKLGSFKKTENQITSHLQNKKGIRYAYYRLLFKPFQGLKQELNKALEKKYNR
jgi:nucleoid DNA-binding protein